MNLLIVMAALYGLRSNSNTRKNNETWVAKSVPSIVTVEGGFISEL